MSPATKEKLPVRVGSRTDVGCVRPHNEDSILVKMPLLVVADGIGGQEAGEVASNIAVETMADMAPMFLDTEQLGKAVEAANHAVLDGVTRGRGKPGMGTTMTAVIIEGDKMAIAQVGDSRAYRYREGKISQLTHDHSLVAAMVENGQLTEAEAREHPSRSIITRALGSDPDMTPDLFEFDLRKGDRILICSDGLSSMITDSEIARILAKHPDPQDAADELVEAAKDAGGLDNVSVIVANISEARPAEETKRKRKKKVSVIVFIAIMIVLIALALGGFMMYAKNSAYLIDQDGYVTLYSGRMDAIAGLGMSELDYQTDISVSLLPEQTRENLADGIQFDSKDKAEEVLSSYATQAEEAQAQLNATTSSTTTSTQTSATTTATQTQGGTQ